MMAGTCGGLQTVPRAELTAMKMVLEHKDDSFPIVTDHKHIVDKIHRGNPDESNKDIWHPIRNACQSEPVVKIKSHDHAAAENGTVDPLHYFANEMADMLADEMADLVKVDNAQCEMYLQEKHWAEIARNRIIDINA